MDKEQLEAKIKQLMYHQKLLVHMIHNKDAQFDQLVVMNNISEEEVIAHNRLL